MRDDWSAHFLSHGPWTSPGGFKEPIAVLPGDVPALAAVVGGLLIHTDYLALYDVQPTDFTSQSRETLMVAQRLQQILEANDAPLNVARAPADRALATCRDYALMLCALLREKSIPARVRCGFARYLTAGQYADHWVCEYWDDGAWHFADAQLDGEQRAHLALRFDTADLPPGAFLTAQQAWTEYRSGMAEGGRFGHGDAVGPWFLLVNLARDLLALGGQEVSAWDDWRSALPWGDKLDADNLARCDELAEAIAAVEVSTEPSGPTAEQASQPFWRATGSAGPGR
ncbi:MAG: transglutaminase domain-containing protein [Aestuariivirgaceae bacterium]